MATQSIVGVRQMNEWEWAAWVAKQVDQALTLNRETNVSLSRSDAILAEVEREAMRRLIQPPNGMVGMARFQRYTQGRTWPRSWACALYLGLAHRYYRWRAHG